MGWISNNFFYSIILHESFKGRLKSTIDCDFCMNQSLTQIIIVLFILTSSLRVSTLNITTVLRAYAEINVCFRARIRVIPKQIFLSINLFI